MRLTWDQTMVEKEALFVGELHAEFNKTLGELIRVLEADKVVLSPMALTIVQSGAICEESAFRRDFEGFTKDGKRHVGFLSETPVYIDSFASEDTAVLIAGETEVAQISLTNLSLV